VLVHVYFAAVALVPMYLALTTLLLYSLIAVAGALLYCTPYCRLTLQLRAYQNCLRYSVYKRGGLHVAQLACPSSLMQLSAADTHVAMLQFQLGSWCLCMYMLLLLLRAAAEADLHTVMLHVWLLPLQQK
jgi:hypothetical protein